MSYGDRLFRYSLGLWIDRWMATTGDRFETLGPSINKSCMQAWRSRLLHNDRALRCNSADPESLKVCTALLLIETIAEVLVSPVSLLPCVDLPATIK